ncbi:hypothetical protein KNU96_gp40 [Xanthomonas phage FoX5]|uniref:Uncharacterized protein n=2 Tax=Foxunavirus TaxID=2948712 RepID=A0A858NMQ8_9CAUD|nr:hypothetical protein KNU93_gp40 [Xanthomonas phage FoX1]YP_010106937.1 hypothetical protein KNU96_gp40 [Xanthomonas phage FoX5]QJB21809.1 hypothetical protein XccvBFoX1_gp70 [Xanthomonas phage FoX1]QJB22050.1 hypothetical protein XccvBFoX5_gp72 [Xanthomonas phage FoX5]
MSYVIQVSATGAHSVMWPGGTVVATFYGPPAPAHAQRFVDALNAASPAGLSRTLEQWQKLNPDTVPADAIRHSLRQAIGDVMHLAGKLPQP